MHIENSSRLKYAIIGILGGMIFVSCLALAVRGYIYYRQPYVKIKDNVFHVEIADTFEKRRLGLMFRKKLSENQGMLFIFDRPAIQTFWMKNTYIPLDIIFIDSDFRIINIETMPAGTLRTCSSLRKARYVLEISAGLCDKLGIKAGDRVIIHR